MNDIHEGLMREATRLTQAGKLREATALIQRALAMPSRAGAWFDGPATAEPARSFAPPTDGLVLDGCVIEVGVHAPPATDVGLGDFIAGTHTNGSLTRGYKLYIPPGHAGRQLPLVVLLHGCTQDPDDFAAGTGMNERAREHDFYVLYPAQAASANPSRCWNWFKHNHQRRDSGEPALLADMVRSVTEKHGIDGRRVYVAGLSAGGAMAVIVGNAYPDIFAAVGVHSGLPSGAAGNVAEALSVMQTGVARTGLHSATPAKMAVPTIVFHGDQDKTVHQRNGEQVIAALLETPASADGAALLASAAQVQVEQGTCDGGRRYTRSVYRGREGRALAEHWLVHGAGHAWSGGQSSGSYTDVHGPDASGEMLRFFFEQADMPVH
ncbi:MAG TPA: PHB depolymerase family esterase [Burkholderiaceae bacterium]|nr:PHB depolymerase family esterase [Burkholderiaceae bacterium]